MRYFFISLLLLLTHSIAGQNQKRDSLAAFVSDYHREDTLRVNALNELSNQYQWINFYHSLQYAEEALKLASKLGYNKGIATAKYLQGHCYWALGDSEIAIELGIDAVKIAAQQSAPFILVESYQLLARSYMDQTEIEKAVHYINEAKKLSEYSKNWDQLSRVYNLAGVIQFVDNNVDSALLLYREVLTISKQYYTERLHTARILSNIGECYARKNADSSFVYFHQGLAVARETNNRAAEAGISAVLGNALVKKGNYQEAELYLQAALRLSRELGLKRVTRHV